MHLIARIVKPVIFKMMFNALKDILREITFDISADGISCTYYDQNNELYCMIDLASDKFDEYNFDGENFTISFNVINLVKILKGVSVKDANFTMDITSTNFCVEIQQNAQSKLYANIDLVERSSLHITRPDISTYPVILDLNMKEFQTTIAQMKTVCHTTPRFQNIEVMFYKNKLTYTVPHNMYGSEIRIEKSVDQSVDTIYAYRVNLQFLINLTKTSTMSPNVYMYIANDKPIFFEYMIGTVGKLMIGINPNELDA